MTILSEALKEKLHELCIISFFPFIHYWLGFKYAQTKILTLLLVSVKHTRNIFSSPFVRTHLLPPLTTNQLTFPPQVPLISGAFAAERQMPRCHLCTSPRTTYPKTNGVSWTPPLRRDNHWCRFISNISIPFSVDAACLRHAPHDLLHVPRLRARVGEDRKELVWLESLSSVCWVNTSERPE